MFSILYVDDEPSLLEIGKLFLENSGMFSVDTVTSAPEALLALAGKRYDAIISDYQMPEMDGIEFLKQVRGAGNMVPFIIFTGRGREEIVIQALNEGADFYLQKGGEPVSQFAELEHKVQMAVLQRKAEASIRDHERREADIINFLPDATFAIDTKGVVIAWNRAIEKMTGVKTSEMLGKDNYEYAIPFYHERRPILIDLVLKDDPVTEGKYPVLSRDGTTLFSEITIPHFNNGSGAELWFTASPLFDTRNTIVGAIESIREITERKQAEEALHESEKRFRELSDLLPQVVYEVDTSGNLMYANKIAFAWFGYSEEEFRKGLNILDMLVPYDRDRAAAAIRAMLEGKRSTETAEEYLALRKDGSTFPISVYSSPVNVNGQITGLRGIMVDITERKKAEYDLKNSVAFLNSLIDQSPTPMWIADGRGILILINKACCDLLCVDEAEVIGKYNIFKDNIIQEQGFMSLVRNVFEKGNVVRFPITYDTKHLKTLHLDQFVSLVLDVTIFPIRDANGKITNAVIQHTNITGRKKAEDALIESEVRFRSLIQNASDMIRIVDREGKIIYESPSTEKIMGYPAGENIGKDPLSYIHPDDLERVNSDLQEIYDWKNSGTPTEFRVKKADGSYIWVDSIATNLLDIPAVNGIVVTTRPIEQRKKMEAALLESEEKYRNVVEDQTEMISRFLPDGTHVFVNEAYCRYFGMKRDEILKHRFRPKIPVEDQERVNHFFVSLTQEHPVDTIEQRIIMPDNSIKWQRWNDRAIFDSSGKVVEYQSVGRDITEKKEAEEALQQRTKELDYRNRIISTLLDTVPIGIFMVEAPSGIPIISNREATRLLGRGIFPDATEKNLAEVYKAHRIGTLERYPTKDMPIVRGMRGESSYIDDMVVIRPDGTAIQLEIFGNPVIDGQGRIVASLASFIDITERKRAEQTIHETNKKINLLTSITRHDVANQVAVLRGFSKIALRKNPDPDIVDLLEKIDTAGATIARHIAFTKTYQELGMHAPGWHRISELVAHQKVHGITLSCSCEAEVFSDPMIEKVFTNLIDNAARHGEHVSTITVNCKPGPDGLVITVEDNGIGVPLDKKERIFEKGYGKHTGFGLFLAREILGITGITIHETGICGKSARFEIHVPKGKYRGAT